MEEKDKEKLIESENLTKVSTDMDAIETPVDVKTIDEPKKSDFPGQEMEHPSIKETSAEKTEEVEKVKPVIIEWKKPFFLMFGLGVAAIILMLILK